MMQKNVPYIPTGYSSLTPYLVVKNAAKAIEFYQKAFNAEVLMQFALPDGKIAHAELQIGDSKLMLGDECVEMDAKSPETYGGSPMGLNLYVKDIDSVVQRAVSLGATLKMPVEDKFYGDRSGSIIDPCGHKWTIATHIEDVTEDEMKKRAAEMFAAS